MLVVSDNHMTNLAGFTLRPKKSQCKRFRPVAGALGSVFALLLAASGCQDAQKPANPAGPEGSQRLDGLSGTEPESAPPDQTPRLLEQRIFVRPGEPAIIFVAVPARSPKAKLSPSDWQLSFDGEPAVIDPIYIRVSRESLSMTEPNRRVLQWLGDQLDWRCEVTPSSSDLPDAASGLWAIQVEIPAGARVATLGATSDTGDSAENVHRATVVPIEDEPIVLALGERLLQDAALQQLRSPALRGADLGMLRAMLERARVPVDQWRVRAMLRALDGPAATESRENAPAAPAPRKIGEVRIDPDLRASAGPAGLIGRHVATRWHAALGRVGQTDRVVAEALAAALLRLVAVPDVGNVGAAGSSSLTVVPLWPGAESGLADLQMRLLESRPVGPAGRASVAGGVGGGAAVEIARAWLAEYDGVPLAWVVDDAGAGALDPSVRSVVLACINPGAAPTVVGARDAMADSVVRGVGEDLLAVPARQARSGLLKVPMADPARAVLSSELTVSLGQRRAQRGVSAPVTPAEPTLALGPLKSDWTMTTLLGIARPGATGVMSAPLTTDTPWITGATLLYSSDAPTTADSLGPPAKRSAWTLFIECRRPATLEPDGARVPETVRLSLGGFGKSRGVIAFDEAGAVQREFSGVFAATRAIKTIREPGRWVAFVPLPLAAIEAGNIVRIGLERTDSRGTHSAWPRMMTPWQIESGRAAISLRPW